MALWENEHLRSERSSQQRTGESWLKILSRWIVQCPQCAEIHLVVGATENDLYVCKDCGHSFAVTPAVGGKDLKLDLKNSIS